MRGSEKKTRRASSPVKDDFVLEYVERKALSRVQLETGADEVVPSLEEVPSVKQLDAWQLGEPVLLFLGAERIVDSGRRRKENDDDK